MATLGKAAGLVFILLAAVAAAPSVAAGRVALVVGNGAYEHAAPLRNPANDAADMAAVLRRLGFAVIAGVDLDRGAFEGKLREFARAARGAEAALFFYAGHGLQVEGENYLLPVDARLAEEVDLELEALELRAFLRQMRSRTNLVFLDACRDNPLARSLARTMGASRSAAIGRGLGRVDAASGTLIAYATQPGNVAADGTGRNSPFTAALLRHIGVPGRSVHDLLTAVTDEVVTATAGRQQPWTHSSLRRPFHFRAPEGSPGAGPTVAAPPSAAPSGSASGAARLTAEQLAAERLFWETVKDSADPAELEAYRKRYPEGTYAALATSRLERLRQAAGESAEPAAPTARPSPEAVETSLGLGRAERRAIQAGLASLGYEPGPADGLFGRRTRAALAAWQAARGEAATGWLVEAGAAVLKAAGEEALRVAAEAHRKERERQEREERARREDDAAFAKARRLHTPEGYRAYLKRGGRHESEARALLAEVSGPKREVGERFRDCVECPEMVVVPAGSFRMGSPASESGRYVHEGPVHRVEIGEPLAVGVYEVTFSEWEACRRGGGCSHNPDDEGWGRGSRPVINVSWEDAQAYVRWLSGKTGEGYRLLTESEWEYVARAGTTTSRYWGNGESGQCAHANGVDGSLKRRYSDWEWPVAPCTDGHVHTSPVGSFRANAWGLHDVLGNVWEWVEDCVHWSYEGAPVDGSAWTAGGYCEARMLRGGSWLGGVELRWFLRSADRMGHSTGDRFGYTGLRVARTLD